MCGHGDTCGGSSWVEPTSSAKSLRQKQVPEQWGVWRASEGAVLWILTLAQSGLTLCAPMDCSLPGSSVHGIFFFRQEFWNGLPLPSPGDLPSLGIEPASLPSPALAEGFFTTVSPGKPTGLWREVGRGRSCGTLLEKLFDCFTLNEKRRHCWV